jgi:hypothetical protein
MPNENNDELLAHIWRGEPKVKPVKPDTFEEDLWDIMSELGSLMLSKHHDYGPKNISLSPGGPLNGLRVRIHDKVARINNLTDSLKSAQNEPLEDSFKDLANYAIIALLVMKGKWPE